MISRISKNIVAKCKQTTVLAEELRRLDKRVHKSVPTRWNSTLAMVRSVTRLTDRELEDLRKKLPTKTEQQITVVRNFALEPQDREKLTELKSVLAPFEWGTDELQCNTVSISRVLPVYNSIISKLNSLVLEYADALRNDLKKSLISRFSSILSNELFQLATFLDPNFNSKFFKKADLAYVTASLKRQLEFSVEMDSLREEHRPKRSRPAEKQPSKQHGEDKENMDYIAFDDDEVSESEEIQTDDADNMINDYLAIVRVQQRISTEAIAANQIDKSLIKDPLLFWKFYESRLPAMAGLAKKYLGVPATSAAVERMFSISGHINSNKRRKTSNKLFEQLVFLKLNEDLL
jgi:hypothetical protein